jgi:hypothetical protein
VISRFCALHVDAQEFRLAQGGPIFHRLGPETAQLLDIQPRNAQCDEVVMHGPTLGTVFTAHHAALEAVEVRKPPLDGRNAFLGCAGIVPVLGGQGQREEKHGDIGAHESFPVCAGELLHEVAARTGGELRNGLTKPSALPVTGLGTLQANCPALSDNVGLVYALHGYFSPVFPPMPIFRKRGHF